LAWLVVLSAVALSAAGFDSGTDYSRQSYSRQFWRTDSGLPQNTVHAVLQTHDGYLWQNWRE
jgi:hypothetical protein